MAPVAVGKLHDRPVAEVAFVAQEGECVFVAPQAFQLSGMRQQQASLTHQIERHVGQRDVLFQHRAVAAPFGQALPEDQGAVSQTQDILDVRRVGSHILS